MFPETNIQFEPGSRGIRGKLVRFRQKYGVVSISAIVVGLAGLGFMLYSNAQDSLATSTDANTVIVQYGMPHTMMPVSKTKLAPAMVPPFTLYGNGLLVCGHTTPMPFMPHAGMPMDAGSSSPPTTRTLTQGQIATLIGQINQTGFFELGNAYYKSPVDGNMETLRVSLLTGDRYVLYYRDVPAPTAYTQTVKVLENHCKDATALYESDTVVVRSVKDAEPQGEPTVDASLLTGPTEGAKKSFAAADAMKSGSELVLGADRQTITGTEARSLSQKFADKKHRFVRYNNSTYEMAVDPQLPKVNNPLKIDFNTIQPSSPPRSDLPQKQKTRPSGSSLGAKLNSWLTPKADAQVRRPVRIVILLAQDGGDTQFTARAQVLNQAIRDWYCAQTGGFCYNSQGVSVMRGSLTRAQYMACPADHPCTRPDGSSMRLLSTFYNIQNSDAGTISRPDVATLVIPGWQTNGAQEHACGYGNRPGTLSISDFTLTPDGDGSTRCFMGQVAAHEWGHNFGLGHTCNNTLMDGSPNCQFAAFCDIGNNDPLVPVCRLEPSQAAELRTDSVYFFNNATFSLLPPAGSAPSKFYIGQRLQSSTNQFLQSPNGQYQLIMQDDRNLVLYNRLRTPIWASNTHTAPRTTVSKFLIRENGEIVIYSDTNALIWSARTQDRGGKYLSLQDDGNLVLYNTINQPLWSTKTGMLPIPRLSVTGKPAVIRTHDGRLEVFARGTDGALYHQWQARPGGNWSGWESFGGSVAGDPAVAMNTDGRLEVFVRGTDNSLYHLWQWRAGSTWSGYENLGGVLTSDPAVARNADGRLEVFVRGGGNMLYHKWQTRPGGAWSVYENLGGYLTSKPEVILNADGRMEVFVVGSGGGLYHQWQWRPGSGWSGYEYLGGILTTGIAAARNLDGRLEVFSRGTGYGLHNQWQWKPGSTWSGWSPLYGTIYSTPTVEQNADGRLEVFVRGGGNAVFHNWQWKPGGTWSGYESLGGALISDIGAARNADGRLEIFAVGSDSKLYHNWQWKAGSTWSGWAIM